MERTNPWGTWGVVARADWEEGKEGRSVNGRVGWGRAGSWGNWREGGGGGRSKKNKKNQRKWQGLRKPLKTTTKRKKNRRCEKWRAAYCWE